jgi:fructosamine-3-kinase
MSLADRIASIVNQRPTAVKSLHGGMIGDVYQIDLDDNTHLVAKVSSEDGTLDIEGYMLRYLRENSRLPVPEVLHAEPSLLVMTYLPGGSNLSADVQSHAADLLADLHAISGDYFGLERDTLIGSLHQPNPPSDSWIAFFRDHRLLYMAQIAHESARLSPALFERIQRFASALERWLHEPPHPSLVHGDLWTTNILAQNGRVTGFIDPAIYYAHPEIELAYTTLFGTFGDPFFRRYTELRPLAPAFFEERRSIYNLYPLLVHVHLFGGSYAASVAHILTRFGY